MKNGKPVVKLWPHDKPIAQISYENWLEEVVNPDTNEFYPARNKEGDPINGTGGKHIACLPDASSLTVKAISESFGLRLTSSFKFFSLKGIS
jgi:hypothetical protein